MSFQRFLLLLVLTTGLYAAEISTTDRVLQVQKSDNYYLVTFLKMSRIYRFPVSEKAIFDCLKQANEKELEIAVVLDSKYGTVLDCKAIKK